MNKKDKFIKFIKQQLNIELENDKTNLLNNKRNVLYTKLPNNYYLFNLLREYSYRYELHMNNCYWIWVDRDNFKGE